MAHTDLDLNPNVDYGVTMGTPMDVKSHPAHGKPKSKHEDGTGLPITALGSGTI